MNELEELLNSVLAADVCGNPPDGMERRIKATLAAARKRSPPVRRLPRQAVAAMLLMGCAAMLAVRYHYGIAPAALPNEERSIAKTVAPGVASGTATFMAVSQKCEVGQRLAVAVRSKKFLRTVVVGIAPIAVESLVIQPIEIASLASDKRAKQSSEWGEQ